MKNIIATLQQAAANKEEIRIKHNERGRIKILPIKISGDTLLADITTVDRLGDSPAKNVYLKLKDITLYSV